MIMDNSSMPNAFKDPNIPGNLFCSPSVSNRAVSATLGDLKYSSSKIFITATTNFRRLLIAVLSPVRMYSSIASDGTPYVSIRNATVTF
jgi:hypothetical protein